MKKLESLLARWRAVEPQQVALGALRIDPMFQPRDVRLVPYADRARQEAASEAHVADLASKLIDGRELEPLLAARIDGKLWLIDGHHRLKAYRREQRHSVPVRIMDADQGDALMVSKAVNCDGVKLPMHTEQKAEGAWQYLAAITFRGHRPLPEGESVRGIGRTFGVDRTKVSRMLRKLSAVNLADYGPDACDPGTGWPQWKYVKGNAIRDRFADVPEDQRERLQDERRAARIGKIIDKDGIEAFLRSLRLIEDEAISAAAERLQAAYEVTEDVEDF